jgi:hypothetical protein
MKQYTHAWLAFMAIKRLEEAQLDGSNRIYADDLIRWFKNHKDGVIRGAWYPDSVIKDMASSHVLKFSPATNGHSASFRKLPSTYLNYHYGQNSPIYNQPYEIDKDDNLPDRCDAIAHSVVDNLKIQNREDKGSPVSPTDNHIALLLFMLSHYIADAHMPLHCDARRFSGGSRIHSLMEDSWDDEIKKHYELDLPNERFFYDKAGYPLRNPVSESTYPNSFLKTVEDHLNQRDFLIGYGDGNNGTWDFMKAVCQYSFLLSYEFIPKGYDHTNVTRTNWDSLGSISFADLTVAVLSDAIDSIARIWFRVWRRYKKWE